MAVPNLEYLVGVKREVRDALRDVFAQVPDTRLQSTNVTLEWPLTPEKYPAIFITFSEGPIRNVGIGHYDLDDSANIADHWRFSGAINLNVAALTPFERDVIAATLINIIAFGNEVPEFKIFHQDIQDYDFVGMTLMKDQINPAGESTGISTWGDRDEQIYTRSYSVELFGEFFTDPQTSQLISINKISIYPYTPDDSIPSGSTNPTDANVPWTV